MADEETDIAIIGAGPAGLITAREAARRGARVTVLEEHEEIGVPCHCAGLLSLRGLAEIDVSTDRGFVQNRVKGARFFSPSKTSFTVERDGPVACVVDRVQFDKSLAREAAQAGADLRLGSKSTKVSQLNEKITATGNFGTIRADIVVDAEGVTSRLIKEMGLQPLAFRELLPALQYDLKSTDIDPEYVEIHVGRKLAPSFFAWVIPLSESSARVGLACKEDNPARKLDKFIKERFEKRRKPSRVYTRSGLIVTSGPLSRTYTDNFLAVGDVAGQVKPTTGGGVILGGICAMIAGKVAAEAVEAGDTSRGSLERYETLWREKLEREFRLTLLARKVAGRLSDKTFDRLFESIIESNLHRDLSLEGDMDFQARTILRVVGRKEILKILLSSAADLMGYLKQ